MKRFTIEDTFAATVDELEALLSAPDFYPRLAAAIPSLRAIELLSREEDEREVRKRVHFTPNTDGKIPGFARGVIKPEMLEWTEESVWTKAEHRCTYRIVPNLPHGWRDRFDSRGTFSLVPAPDGVRRIIESEIHVRIPLLGGTVERMLWNEVRQNFRAETAAMTAWLAERRRGM